MPNRSAIAGGSSPELILYTRSIVWALCPLSILFVIMNFELAQKRYRITFPLVLCAVAYLAGVYMWHKSPLQIVAVLGLTGTLAFILSILCLPWRAMNNKNLKRI